MPNNVQDLLRIYPFLSAEKQRKAGIWLRNNGFDSKSIVPSEQQYSAPSPSGRAKLVRIPMFLENLGGSGQGLGYYNNAIVTDAGQGVASEDNNTTILNLLSTFNPVLNQYNSAVSEDTTFGHFTVKGMTFSTRKTPWAKMRVAGIEVVLNNTPMQPCLPNAGDTGESIGLGIGYACPPRVLLKNYRVSGSANLFLQDGYIDGTFFSVDRFQFGGLRAYPILESPKTLKLDIAISGEHYHGSVGALATQLLLSNDTEVPSNTALVFSVNAIVDILDDEDYGASSPSIYGRGLNIERITPENGQSFIKGT